MIAGQGARAILAAFDRFHTQFKAITRRSGARFEAMDWRGAQADSLERLDLYARVIQDTVAEICTLLGENVKDQATWGRMKSLYSGSIADRDDFELAETFFNSVTRRIFSTVGVAASIEFIDSDFEPPVPRERPVARRYLAGGASSAWLRAILGDYAFQAPYADLERDIELAAAEIDRTLTETGASPAVRSVELLRPVFFRGKGAYLIGRIQLAGGERRPLVIVLLNDAGGIYVDAVLLSEDEASILFSFTRAYFHVETDTPHELIAFLKSIMPHKRVAELYIAIGYNKHGKTELYRDLLRHLAASDDQFEIAPGEKGMVMMVFTMPSYDMVFKIIKDRFADPKTSTRQEVMDRYQLVFKHDRAGRLIDAQEFEHLQFDCHRFSKALLQELQAVAAGSVTLAANTVAIKHLYMERRTTPLDVYVRSAGPDAVREAVIDYGQAIKDLAATNIFPGDILTKNFGVTRHGRVVFYDYDELTLLTNCKFRKMPSARDFSDDFEAEPWFFVGKDDIFPEEFETFLGLPEPYRGWFNAAHADLFAVRFWKQMQARHRSGEVVDIFPYKQERRLQPAPPGAGP